LKVEIGLLHDLPRAKMVFTEPITADDWEIIVSNQNLGFKILSLTISIRKFMQRISSPPSFHK
jgi:hypothetical protein